MNPATVTAQEIVEALAASGVRVTLDGQWHVGLREAARRLDIGPGWVREHLASFPNAWRMEGGELRIPIRDIEAYANSRKLRRVEA